MNRQSYLAILGSFLALLTAPALAHDKITTVLGGGPNGIPGIATDLPGTGRIAADTQGNLYIVDGIGAVFKLSTSGIVTHIAGKEVTARMRADAQVRPGQSHVFAFNLDKAVLFDPVSTRRI